MDPQAAVRLAEQHFPKGPETLAEAVGAEIRVLDINVDGWCLQKPGGGAIVTLRESAPETRRRFTLAHELAHLVLGTPGDVLGHEADYYDPRSAEEQSANQLGSELLIPSPILSRLLKPPVDARAIARVAKAANASEMVVALRAVKAAEEFQMRQGTVVHLDGDSVKWQFPNRATVNGETAGKAYRAAVKAGGTHRYRSKQGLPVLAAALSNPDYPALLLYLMTDEQAAQPTYGERRQQLEAALFDSHRTFQRRLQGVIGAARPKLDGMNTEDAFQFLFDRCVQNQLDDDFPGVFEMEVFSSYLWLRVREYTLQVG